MPDDHPGAKDLDSLAIPFLFVPHGDPEPVEWMTRHPGWVKIPATTVPRRSAPLSSARKVPPTPVLAATLGTTAVAAPELLTGLGETALVALSDAMFAPLVGLAILFKSSPTGSASEDAFVEEVQRERARRAAEGLIPPPARPPVPGLKPPIQNQVKPGEGGFTPSPPAPPLPGFTPVAPQSNVLAGPEAKEQAPTILQQSRNDGLSGGMRTNSRRARNAARSADKAVTEALQSAEWRAHHLINIAGVRSSARLIREAARAGWRTDDPPNVAALPVSPEAQEKLKEAGHDRPVHDSGHPDWNRYVRNRLREIEQYLNDHGLIPGSDTYARSAEKELEKLQEELRQKLMESGRLTWNERTNATAPV